MARSRKRCSVVQVSTCLERANDRSIHRKIPPKPILQRSTFLVQESRYDQLQEPISNASPLFSNILTDATKNNDMSDFLLAHMRKGSLHNIHWAKKVRLELVSYDSMRTLGGC